MREHRHTVSLFDTGLKPDVSEFRQVLEEKKPDALILYDDGFNYLTKMCLTNMREAAFDMIAMAKELNLPVLVSSSDSTDHYTKYLEAGADIIMLGEAEETLKECLHQIELNKSLEDVKGIAFRKNGDIVCNPRRPVIRDLDTIPAPAWDLIDIDAYKRVWASGKYDFAINVATTRGCPFKCNWCAKPIYGNRYNSRSPKEVVAELDMLTSTFGTHRFWMCDDIFGLKPGWVKQFKDELQKRNLKISYKIQSRADLLLEEDNIQDLADSGLYEVWLGAESGSQKILDAMDKGTTIEQIKTSTKKLQSLGVRVAFFLQFGYQGETRDDIDKTIAMVRELKPDDIGISVSYPLPGTKFFDRVKEELGNKQNWTDSDDLAMMFKGTFNSTFYKTLQRLVHRMFRKQLAIQFVKNGFRSSDPLMLRNMLLLPYNAIMEAILNIRLRRMNNR